MTRSRRAGLILCLMAALLLCACSQSKSGAYQRAVDLFADGSYYENGVYYNLNEHAAKRGKNGFLVGAGLEARITKSTSATTISTTHVHRAKINARLAKRLLRCKLAGGAIGAVFMQWSYKKIR